MKAQEIKVKIDAQEKKLQELQEELALIKIPTAPLAITNTQSTPQDQDMKEDEPKKAPAIVIDEELILHKCLTMMCELLQANDITGLNATLQTLLDEFVVKAAEDQIVDIRALAVRALGCLCVRSVESAKRTMILILQMAHLDAGEVRQMAIKVIFDLLMCFGLQAFEGNTGGEDNNGEIDFNNLEAISSVRQDVLDSSLAETYLQGANMSQHELSTQGGHPVVAILCKLLDDRDLDIRTLVAEGLCKLLIAGTITSSKLFKRLILIWYNPLTEANGRLRHILGAFFPLYASMSKMNQDTIEDAFLPTLKTLFDAPVTSPLNEVDIEDVGQFMIQLTSQGFLQQANHENNENDNVDDTNTHDSMAMAICSYIIANSESYHVKTLLKLLLHLQVIS